MWVIGRLFSPGRLVVLRGCLVALCGHLGGDTGRTLRRQLLDGELGVIAVAGDDGVLLGLALLVLHT